MTTHYNRSLYSVAMLSSLATVLLTAVTGYSQTTETTAAAADQTIKLQKFEVTGSYIPAAADESKAMPIQVLDSAAIESTGINSSLLDVLRKSLPQIEGPGNMGQENANTSYNSTAGGSRLAVHGLPTLVLIDGKRVSESPIGAAGGYNFVDLNLIPVSAVERIEVLTDGASAIYGADAVAGVVNIILKKNFQGGEFGFSYSGAQQDLNGWAHDRQLSMIVGAATKDTSVLVSAQWFKNDPLYEGDFNMTNPYYGTSTYAGIVNSSAGVFYSLKPGLNAPPTPAAGTVAPTFAQLVANGTYVVNNNVAAGFNLGLRPTFQSGNQKKIATFNVTHDFNSNYSMKADFIYSNTETGSELNPQPVSVSLASIVGTAGLPVSDTTGYTIRNRFTGFPNRQYTTVNNFYRFTLDFTGKVNDYINFDAFINYNAATELERDHNLILSSALTAGIKAGLVNMFAINQNAANIAQANFFGTAFGNYESKLIDQELIFHGKIIEIPSGEVSYAAGYAYRKENLIASSDYNSQVLPGGGSLWNNGTTINPFDQGFNNTSTFAEVKVPVTSPKNAIPFAYLITLDGAMRHESYSGGNKVTVPKYSIRYLPLDDQLAFRATVGKSFRSPSLYDLYGPLSSGFTSSPGGLNAYNSSGVATGSKFPNLQAQSQSGSNPNLKPESSKTWTAGAVISPRFLKGFELSVDYFNTKYKDQIGAPASALTMMQSVEQLGPKSPFAQYVTIGNFPALGGKQVTAPGQVSTNIINVYVQSSSSNIGGTTESGADFSAKYTFRNETYGRFVVTSTWAYLRSYFQVTGPTDPGTEYAGTVEGGSLPHLRSYSSLQYTYRGFGATLGYTHLPKIPDFSGGFETPWNTFDIQTRYDLGKLVDSSLNGVDINLGLNNITNQKPPIDANVFGNPPADTGTYGVFGRTFYVDVKYKF